MKKIILAKLIKKEQLKDNIFKYTLESDELSQIAKPGQFIDIKCDVGLDILLRRPISISQINSNEKTISIIFEVKGKGTRNLSNKNIGDYIDVLGPLGNSFSKSEKYKTAAILGGGIGIFPLIGLLENMKIRKLSFLGFREKSFVILEDQFKKVSDEVFISTDDGSYGFNGRVTEQLEIKIKEEEIEIIYACGPKPMLKAVQTVAKKYNIPCQISLEERMGCGVGACLGCACKTGKNDNWEYKHVCADGPIFWSDEVIFDE